MRIILSLIIIFFASHSWGATIYLNPTGANGEYGNLQAAIAAMSGGDTLIIRDGTYTGSTNIIDDAHRPPSGSSGAFTTIRAQNAGSVTFSGEYVRNPFYIDSNSSGALNYLHVDGINFINSNNQACFTVAGTVGTYNSHIWLSRCGFIDAGRNAASSMNGLYMRRTDYGLIENCYTAGELYYGLLIEQCSNSVMRQCVGRYDLHRGPLGGVFGIYSSSYIEVQNCIAIDCDNDAGYTGVTGIYGFAFPTTDGPSTNVYVRGCIALNLNADNKIITGLVSSNGGGSGFLFENFIGYDTSGGFWDRLTGNAYTSCVFGLSKGNIVSEGIAGAGTLTYSLIFGNITRGSNVTTANYNDYYNNGVDGNTGTGNVTVNPETSGYLYLPRIETGSVLDGYGMGPDVTKIIGTSGTFYGETGYNTETATDLWPYPNEDLIQDAFAAYTGNSNGSVTGARGFCASGTRLDGVNPITLTSYIWEYLGNEIPDDIYGEAPVYDAPTITGPADFSTTASSVEIEGTYTIDSELTVDTITWTLGESSGFCVAALGVFSCTVPVDLGVNSIVLRFVDSIEGEDSDTTVVTRTPPPSATSRGKGYNIKGCSLK